MNSLLKKEISGKYIFYQLYGEYLMDSIIKNYKVYGLDEDLAYCDGIAYQLDMSKSVSYDKDYYEKYIKMAGSEIANKLNHCRTTLTEKWCGGPLLDIGIGSGEFIESSKIKVYGFDINPYAVRWLEERNIFVNPYKNVPEFIHGWTFWDTLEHIREPHITFSKIRSGSYVFVSIPIMKTLLDIKQHKHYRPNEHYYYFTTEGFVRWMGDHGFNYKEHNDLETKAGRESIETFVFLKI